MQRVALIVGFNLWSLRTPDEVAFGDKLADLWSTAREWRGIADFSGIADLRQHAILWRYFVCQTIIRFLSCAPTTITGQTWMTQRLKLT